MIYVSIRIEVVLINVFYFNSCGQLVLLIVSAYLLVHEISCHIFSSNI
jgi:hypothetical protein